MSKSKKQTTLTWNRFYEFSNYNTRGDASTVPPAVEPPTFEEAQIMADEILRLRTLVHRLAYDALETHSQTNSALQESPFTGSYGYTKMPGLDYKTLDSASKED